MGFDCTRVASAGAATGNIHSTWPGNGVNAVNTYQVSYSWGGRISGNLPSSEFLGAPSLTRDFREEGQEVSSSAFRVSPVR